MGKPEEHKVGVKVIQQNGMSLKQGKTFFKGCGEHSGRGAGRTQTPTPRGAYEASEWKPPLGRGAEWLLELLISCGENEGQRTSCLLEFARRSVQGGWAEAGAGSSASRHQAEKQQGLGLCSGRG